VIVAERWKGFRALAGLGLSLIIVVGFIVPAILDGRSPEGVAIVGALAVMLVTIPLAHGLGQATVAACLGTSGSLLLTLGLASLFTELAHLTACPPTRRSISARQRATSRSRDCSWQAW
jgi:uncharacterized membrane protein